MNGICLLFKALNHLQITLLNNFQDFLKLSNSCVLRGTKLTKTYTNQTICNKLILNKVGYERHNIITKSVQNQNENNKSWEFLNHCVGTPDYTKNLHRYNNLIQEINQFCVKNENYQKQFPKNANVLRIGSIPLGWTHPVASASKLYPAHKQHTTGSSWQKKLKSSSECHHSLP